MKTRILRPLLAASLVLGCCLSALAEGSVSAPSADGKKVNINQASAEQLSYLPRVGVKAAQKVVDYRKAKGPFARPEDLMEVKGFGEKKF
jgi:competence protein ComEA